MQRVVDLLGGPVAAAADDVGVEAGEVERLGVGVDVREGAQQQHHRAAGDPLLVGQLPQARGQESGLGDALGALLGRRGGQLRAVLAPALVLGQQQLHGGLRAGRDAGGLRIGQAADAELVEVVEQHVADRVDGGDDRRRRAEAAAEREHRGLLGGAAALAAEALEVGAAEGVDRLELVADREQPALRSAQRRDQPDLQRARVLELVDEQMVEALALGPGDGVGAGEQLEAEQLQVVEVDSRALGLDGGVAAPVGEQQGADRRVRRLRELQLLLRCRCLLAVLALEGGDLERRQVGHRLPVIAEVVVGGPDQAAQAAAAIGGGDRRDPVVDRGELRERLLEGDGGEPRGLVGVEDAEPGVEPGRDRMGGEQAPAEAVDRRDRSALAGPGGLLQSLPPLARRSPPGRGGRARPGPAAASPPPPSR